MKKITILRDKKIFYLVLVSLIYDPVSFYLTDILSYPQNLCNTSYHIIWSLFTLGIFIFYLVLLKQVYLKIKINDDIVSFGLTSWSKFNVKSISAIHISDSINLTLKTTTFKIGVIDIDNNEHNYRHLIDHINHNSNVMVDTDRAIETLKQNRENKYKKDDGKPLAFGGCVSLLLIHLIMTFIMFVNDVFFSDFLNVTRNTLIELANFIMSIVMLSYSIYVLYHVIRKKRKTLNILKPYIWIIAIVFVVSDLVTVILFKETVTWMIYIGNCINLLSQLLTAMIILRYLAVSKRVKHTFIKE